ncbi:hypothetical protein BCR43DRAFT_415491, partial [Syncephalastrum racemosum]
SASAWSALWRTPMPHIARSTWYRLLHLHVSCAALLHRIMPDKVTSPICRICQVASESPDDMILTCPTKQSLF